MNETMNDVWWCGYLQKWTVLMAFAFAWKDQEPQKTKIKTFDDTDKKKVATF